METNRSEVLRSCIDAALSSVDISLPEESLQKLLRYDELLIYWNERMNLTNIVEAKDVAEKHFADSLLPLCFDLIPQNASVIDVGTGAGFPGLVLAIARPDIKLTLLDSLKKRVDFLQDLCTDLGITAEFVHGRAEDAGQSKLRSQFDLAVSRAVAPAAVLMELTLPFVKRGSYALAYKGQGADDEFGSAKAALRKLGAGLDRIYEKDCVWGKRSLVMVRQINSMHRNYPRKAGTPSRNPLS